MKLELSRQIFEKTPTLNFMKIRPVATVLFHLDRRTDMTKLIVAFRNFAKAPKYVLSFLQSYYSFSHSQETAWFAAVLLPLYAIFAGWHCHSCAAPTRCSQGVWGDELAGQAAVGTKWTNPAPKIMKILFLFGWQVVKCSSQIGV